MATQSAVKKRVRRGQQAGSRQAFYASPLMAAEAEHGGRLAVKVSIADDAVDPLLVRELIVARLKLGRGSRASGITKVVREATRDAVTELLSGRLAGEVAKVVSAYGVMLREGLARGDDPALQAALNRARLQEKILAGTTMVDQAQACELLGLSNANPSATMKRKEERREVLRFATDGRVVYPLFQFDVEGRRAFPVMAQLIERKPTGWSDFRLLHWLTRPHLDFDTTPADAFGSAPDAVLAAFDREVAAAATS